MENLLVQETEGRQLTHLVMINIVSMVGIGQWQDNASVTNLDEKGLEMGFHTWC